MSDIWHEPTETPVENKTLLFDSIEFDETEMGVYSGGLFHSYNEFEPLTPAGLSRWAYLADFINCQKELDRTRKALDWAINAMESASNHNVINCVVRGVDPKEDDVNITLFKALEQINEIKGGK